MADLRVQSLKQPVNVAEYLFKRLYEFGVRSVHGVPGDYNLVALDYIPRCGLKWVGSVNELNAGQYLYPLVFLRSESMTWLIETLKLMLPTAMLVSRSSRLSSQPSE